MQILILDHEMDTITSTLKFFILLYQLISLRIIKEYILMVLNQNGHINFKCQKGIIHVSYMYNVIYPHTLKFVHFMCVTENMRLLTESKNFISDFPGLIS